MHSRLPRLDLRARIACPRDGAEMSQVEVDDVPLDRCQTCGGTWFDAKELRRVAGDKEMERLATRVPIVKTPSGFACPRCGGECVEGHVSEVAIDHCLACSGVFLDKGELEEARRQLETQRLLSSAGPGFRSFLAGL